MNIRDQLTKAVKISSATEINFTLDYDIIIEVKQIMCLPEYAAI